MIFLSGAPALPLLIFTLSLSIYHISEFLLVLILEPEELDFSSFLLSQPYLLAMSFGLLEYSLTWHYFPAQKSFLTRLLLPPGTLLAFSGDILRKLAWLTARSAFTHRIKHRRRPGHVLVTNGVYRWSRHPGYVGWLVWAVGTQVVLANPIAIVAFALISFSFFKDRIPVEEFHLVAIFGQDYINYRETTPTRIPGIA